MLTYTVKKIDEHISQNFSLQGKVSFFDMGLYEALSPSQCLTCYRKLSARSLYGEA